MGTSVNAGADQLRDIARLMDLPEPVTSLYLGLADRDDPRRINERWTSLRHRADGAPADDLAALEGEVRGSLAHAGPRGLVAFAEQGAIRLTERLEGWEGPDRLSSGPLPAVVPLLGWLQCRLACVVVVTDHTGADIATRTWPDAPLGSWHVEGADDEIRAVQSGGWAALAMSRFQRRVVDSWQHNARQVAHEVGLECERSGAGLLVLSGDLRSVQLVHEALPEQLGRDVEIIPAGTRGSAGPAPGLSDAVDRLAAARCRSVTSELVQLWSGRVGRGSGAASGARQTAKALAEGAVDTLLLEAGTVDREAAWITDRPEHVSVSHDDVTAGHGRVPLGDALVRAAFATGASVRVVPAEDEPGLPDGVGALLRHA